MGSARVQIVNAVYYEGYILYPDLASSRQNQREQLTFGRVYPKAFAEGENGAGSCSMQTECLFQTGDAFSGLKITLEFLQPMARRIGSLENALKCLPEKGKIKYQDVPQLEVAGRVFHAWMEAVERKVSFTVRSVMDSKNVSFAFPATENREPIHNEKGEIVGVILRRHDLLEGRIETKITRLENHLFRISVRTANLSALRPADLQNPEKILQRTFASTHFTLELGDGEFVSPVNPPSAKCFQIGDCRNIGCRPALAEAESEGDRIRILASPIRTCDDSQIASESTGRFLDAMQPERPLAPCVFGIPDDEKGGMCTPRDLKAAA